MTEWKKCSNCHQSKDIESFGINSKNRPSRRSVCNTCRIAINTRYILEKKLESNSGHLWECPSCDHIQTKRKITCVKCGEVCHAEA